MKERLDGENPSQRKDTFQDIPLKILKYCSQDCSNEPTHVERILIDKLKEYSTSCGGIPNHPFTSKVITFIKANSGKDFVIAEIWEGTKIIQNLAVHWNGNERTKLSNTDKFSDMISNNDGSLRADQSFEEGWDTYESE